MKLEHSFTVPVGVDEAWKILLDINLIGPCMPGAAIDSVDGDDFTGTVKVKLGPIGLTYKGKASFVEKDEAAHRAVIDARGRDARGNGTAAAKVTAVLTEQGGATLVNVDTDLDITGRPAQFGRGVMVDVGNKLIGQFADNLAATISADHSTSDPAPGAAPPTDAPPTESASSEAASSEAASGESASGESAPTGAPSSEGSAVAEVPATDSAAAPAGSAPAARAAAAGPRPGQSTEPINLIQSAGPAVAKRLAPVAAAVLVAAAAVIVVRRRR